MPALSLTKHHGLGNDFLVMLDRGRDLPFDAGLAKALCDRHTGIGADGFIRCTPSTDGANLTFELRNADGSPAEMSGNGLRCMAQAAFDDGMIDRRDFTVATPAGVRAVSLHQETGPGLRQCSVDMGLAKVTEVANQPDQLSVDVGNPHLVVKVDDLTTITGSPDPTVNVEFVVVGPEPDAVTMRVFERGVGETLACGTGAVAAAAAVHRWGLAGTRVTVHQPGGDGIVDLRPNTVVLTGPTQRIARISVDA